MNRENTITQVRPLKKNKEDVEKNKKKRTKSKGTGSGGDGRGKEEIDGQMRRRVGKRGNVG